MNALKLSYFGIDGGRGEAIRLAFAIGGIEFEDDRFPLADWPERQPSTPFHAVPVLEVDGEAITQSNSILRFAGRLTGLYPEDPLVALRCDEAMGVVEDALIKVVGTFGIKDAEELRSAREALVAGPLDRYLRGLEKKLLAQGGEWFAAGRLTVADLKVFVWIRSLEKGVLDHVPVDLVERIAPALSAHCARVAADARIVAYYESR